MNQKQKLLELIDQYAEARHIQGHSTYNIKTAAARQAVIEALSGVQALSAAPAGWKLVPVEPTVDQEWAGKNAALRCSTMGEACKIYKAMLAASPPAEQTSITPETGNSVSAQGAAITSESGTPPAEQQAAPKAAPGDVLDEALRERDDAEDFIDALLDEVLGHERPEWSSSYGRADALNDVQERMTALHKPAVDKAWGRFQSAMAAPQQEAQEPVAWQGVHDKTDLYYTKPIQADVRPLYAAPQPAPAPLSDDTERLEWLLWKLPGDALRYVVGVLADTSSGAEFRAAIDTAIAAQGGKV